MSKGGLSALHRTAGVVRELLCFSAVLTPKKKPGALLALRAFEVSGHSGLLIQWIGSVGTTVDLDLVVDILDVALVAQ